ncbi:MAG: tyrosine-type recombinase/integrase [Flavobacteriaceae bacterium]|nr:MAG: tyrosine-type recombinase/integrase [Flavobacteriaceae bacterium]QMU63611.1 MAG: tyrosine-type recombinase/integrase [Flavobacteriaceae bacterium]QMU65793.1 MAG: tyrosine-type recombinase/integrase [Flavobacteriaceae bacterium]
MQDFINYLQTKNHAEITQKKYTKSVADFLKWFTKEDINTTKKDVLEYLSYLKKNLHQTNSRRKGDLTALRHYFTFLQQNDLIATNPTNFLKIRGARKKTLYNIYSFAELEQLNDNFYHNFIRNFNYNKYVGENDRERSLLCRERNYCMLGMLVYQGLLTKELKKIKLTDLDLNKATLKIQKAKKSNGRTIVLNATQIGVLINYTQQIRPKIANLYNQETEQLFLSYPISNEKNNIQDFRGVVQYLAKQVKKIDSNFLNFKQLRASVITNWIKNEGLRKAQYLAGHRYISSTESYKVNDLESLTDDIAKHHPF